MVRPLVAAALVLLGCSSEEPAEGTRAVFDVAADLRQPESFYRVPWPSDLRLVDDRPVIEGFPNPDNYLIDGLAPLAVDRPRWPTVPVAFFQFEAGLAPRDPNAVVLPAPDAPVLLVDVDESSPERGRLIPTVTSTPAIDPYVPAPLLAVAPRPGFVLAPNRRYAFVVTEGVTDAAGRPVVAADAFAALRDGGSVSAEVDALYAPLFGTLDAIGVSRQAVVAATVFTTGDVVAETHALTEAMRDRYTITLDDLAVDPDDGAAHPRFCELHGTMTLPQFQRGEPPFDSEGVFVFENGELVEQRTEVAPIVITLPKGPMPPEGYPLVMYFHGSGGVAAQVVDRGKVTEPGGEPTKGEGPAHVLAAHGFATVGSAHPVNPERLPGAGEIAYLNIDNLGSFRDTFRQGVIEQRLYLDALLALEIPPALVEACDLPPLPAGESGYHFDPAPILAMGQSMGGMYTNMIGAVEPRIAAVAPTGAGGFWGYFILETTLVGGKGLLPILLDSDPVLTFMHPALALLELAWEPAEPMVYMPRLGLRPLDGHPVRPVYEPVGLGDSYFPSQLYDAIALAYGHQQAGEEVWPSMQEALALDGRDGIVPYPVVDNLKSGSKPFTGVVVQYEGDGIYDPHAIYGQLDAVKHQYGCFFETFFATGSATVVAPAELGSPCQ